MMSKHKHEEKFIEFDLPNYEEPKLLYFDIETSPIVALAWGGHKQFISMDQIIKDRKVLSICYLWGHEKEHQVHTMKMDMSKHNINSYDDDADREMINEFAKIYNTADLAIAHNGRGFDVARIRARLVKYKIPDLSKVMFDDSYKFCKDIDFTFHKLDYLGKFLEEGRKIHVDFDLWKRIMLGDNEALEDMVTYNKKDVVQLRRVHKRLLPYCKSSLNAAAFANNPNMCISPGCKGKLIINQYRMTTALGRRLQKRCVKCGKTVTMGVNALKHTKYYPR